MGGKQMRFKITNNIMNKIEEYQEKTGATKTWIAKKLGMSSQRFYDICKSDNITIGVIIPIIELIGYKFEDLITWEVINE
jgi:DNA-binding XRE family transcriptional regulator